MGRMSTRRWRPWRRSDDDFHREIQAHLEFETDRLIADGWIPTLPAARRSERLATSGWQPNASTRGAAGCGSTSSVDRGCMDRETVGRVTQADGRGRAMLAAPFVAGAAWMWLTSSGTTSAMPCAPSVAVPPISPTTVATLAIALALVTSSLRLSMPTSSTHSPFPIPIASTSSRGNRETTAAPPSHGASIRTSASAAICSTASRSVVRPSARVANGNGVVAHRFTRSRSLSEGPWPQAVRVHPTRSSLAICWTSCAGRLDRAAVPVSRARLMHVLSDRIREIGAHGARCQGH